ncbi:TetR family transcriptional regulator [Sanguibacter antarcticus]|uniref:TetR family transcriptional regulator n=2 Tax=Sanguibacter antarcticus TaxID=372484 RepID=A0A2A9E146_9MICO|nr:TetR family transcriptional regulator [Sanguibacter antarcticus]
MWAVVRAGITTERVALAGAELADEIGFDRVTVAEVARRFGVKTASLYSHVTSSADLSQNITLLALEEMADRAADAVAGRSRLDALAGLANAYRDYAREHPGRFAATLAALDPEIVATSAGPRHARLIEAVLHGYELDRTAQVHAIRMLGSVVRGFITLEMSGSFAHSEPDPGESWTATIEALHALLCSWPTADVT